MRQKDEIGVNSLEERAETRLQRKMAKFCLLTVGVVLCALGNSRGADDNAMNVPPGSNYMQNIGLHSLADPSGHVHTRQEVAGKVCVAIFSAPNMSQGDRQERWSHLLADKPETKLSSQVALILVEDMTQAGAFKQMALDSMKKSFTPHSRPFLILDEDGKVFKKFGVVRDKTEILVYDKRGNLRDVETKLGEDDEENTVRRLKAITQKLLAE